MPEIQVETRLSPEDLTKIIDGVTEAVRPLLESRPAFVPTDAMSVIANVSPATLGRLRRAKTIPSTKVGNRRLYRPERVIEALERLGDSTSESEGDEQ